MKKILIINAGQEFEHSGGKFNNTITAVTKQFFDTKEEYVAQITNVTEEYDPQEEVKKFVWADVIIYHTPIWWFSVPFGFKKYLDDVFSAGHNTGIYKSDGRSSANPDINYGTGGMLHGRQYMLTSSWNAPAAAFTLPGEFFDQTSVDKGVMFGFHRMNAFAGLSPLKSYHFHDVEKHVQIEKHVSAYTHHLQEVFATENILEESLLN
ncbi:modulator of drug activity B [Chitinophaga dinghuensis]|uniref:Modulator of drug activity B n=1 Tax=Chitinophaga dinghuensis TaxID=1539050 RepID=A0A327VUB6_9BACT|nr:NAD(P)H-dependent oxidoreductase [Chitinophaga dinghuensis]RAJ79072.1 modulator of drug activity B [Chitinophaga dinghuensis]